MIACTASPCDVALGAAAPDARVKAAGECARLPRPMSRRSLRSHLNQIRAWVRQGRTDAWIAHQLEVTVQQIQSFKRDNELVVDGGGSGNGAATDFDDEIDLRAEDDALIAVELEAAEAKRKAEEERAAEEARVAREKAAAERERAAAERKESGEPEPEPDSDVKSDDEDDDDAPRRRRRGRRGGRGRRRSSEPQTLDGSFDHGEEGYGLWLDPAVQDDPIYAEHWAGHRPIEVTVEEDQIVIRRAGTGDGDAGDDD